MRPVYWIVALVSACSASPPDVLVARQLPPAMREDATAVARANNQFACDLYRELAADGGNLFLSPFSISTALAMVDAGAAGTTDEELRQALHVTLPGERVHAAYHALLASLDTGRGYGAYTLDTANRLFGQVGEQFLPDFLAITRNEYGAELMPVDFERDPEAARGVVNAWVAAQTDRKIPELFDPGAIDATTRLVLANAIVFKGSWADRFDRSRTASAPFQLANGSSVQVPMMHKLGAIAIAGIPGGRVGVLPFRGDDLSMVVVLPDRPDGLPAIEAQLTGDAIAQWIDQARSGERTEVGLPKLGLADGFDLPGTLARLGITRAFDPAAADFSPIDGRRDLYLHAVVHKAVLSVDEDGAEAAAATGVGVGITSTPAPFEADHPFVVLIYDHVTGSILFLGRVQDPTRT